MDTGVNMTHDDFCYKPITGKGCLVTSPMQYWESNLSDLLKDEDVKVTSQCLSPPGGTKRVCFDKIGVPVMQFTIFGKLSCEGVQSACNACKVKASGLQTTFLLNNNAFQFSSANEWEK
jgi:Niemann-Pick C1 protein